MHRDRRGAGGTFRVAFFGALPSSHSDVHHNSPRNEYAHGVHGFLGHHDISPGESKAKALGHPIHQMLVPFPFGLLATAAIFDVIYLVWGNATLVTGDWDREPVKSICVALDLSHVVDPFIGKTVTPDKCYFRLHGRNGWRYQYEVNELEELAANVSNRKAGYVFFNNRTMTADALKFCRLLN